MHVLHASLQFHSGGAARAARRILDAQVSSEIEVSTLSAVHSGNPHPQVADFEIDLVRGRIQGKMERAVLATLGLRDGNDRSLGFLPSSLPRAVARIEPDILNLHWLGRSFLAGWQLRRIDAPVIWTLHDLWAASGALHYPASEWVMNESAATQFFASQRSLRSRILEFALRSLKKISAQEIIFIAPTSWLADEVTNRLELSKSQIHQVPIPIPTQIFSPGSVHDSREALGIPNERPIVGFASATSSHYAIKGSHFLSTIMTAVRKHVPDALLVTLDKSPTSLSESRDRCVANKLSLSFIGNDDELVKFYRSCDVVVVPSILDNFNQVAAEALACGTPVVAFDNSGLSTVVQDAQTGLLAPAFDAYQLGERAAEILTSSSLRSRLSSTAQHWALEHWSYRVVGKQYHEIYRGMW